jgi:hypothetical protein
VAVRGFSVEDSHGDFVVWRLDHKHHNFHTKFYENQSLCLQYRFRMEIDAIRLGNNLLNSVLSFFREDKFVEVN